ncbi:hypothetical protein ACNKHP_09305 [Shigella boydii]
MRQLVVSASPDLFGTIWPVSAFNDWRTNGIQHFLPLRGVRSDMAFNKSAAVFKLA